jgi:putative salt-induced outer membrane protein YdiY
MTRSAVLAVTLALAGSGVIQAQELPPLTSPSSPTTPSSLPTPELPAQPAPPGHVDQPQTPPLLDSVPPPRFWHGGVELGLTGSDGNRDLVNLRLGGTAKRKTDDNILALDLLYRYATTNAQATENHLLLHGRDELLLPGTPWNVFLDGSAEYDEFMGYQERIASHAGIGYHFLKNDTTCLTGRLGAGVSKNFSGPITGVVPEGLVGLDFERKLTERGKFTAGAEYFPSFERLDTYRIIAKVAYEWLIDPEWNLTFKVGALDRYDTATTAKNPRPNDIEYFATLLWKF